MINLILIIIACTSLLFPETKVSTGAEKFINEGLHIVKGKKLGIVTNHTAVLPNGVHLVDTLFNIKEIEITALFGPEHGIRGNAPAGKKIDDTRDERTNIPVFSLYGQNRKPTEEMLKDVDILIFDIQDIGARFYTYISTLFYVLEAGAEFNIPVIVLDRPNPIGGIWVDGPIRQEEFHSFVGIAPIPVMHGMTVAELAKMFEGESWLKVNNKLHLIIFENSGWNREMFFDETNLPWLNPSPNIPNLETAIVYPGTCLFEGTNVAEGRGTYEPFLTIGAPFLNSKKVIEEMNKTGLKGFTLTEKTFTPVEIPEMASSPKFKGELCNGISIKVTDRKNFEPWKFGVALVYVIHKLHKDKFTFRESSINRLSGDKRIREMIINEVPLNDIFNYYKNDVEIFKNTIRKKYLIYN